jgi:Protein of unknown function (DUF402)
MTNDRTGTRVRVRKKKWPLAGSHEPRTVARWDARVLGVDEFGTWLYCAKGELHHKADGSTIVVPSDGVQLLPSSGWWAAWWWREKSWIGVDICTPPRLDESGWSYIDLELDLARLADGEVMLVDEDEFERAIIDCRLPDDVVAALRSTAAEIRSALARENDPVVAAGWNWLARA